MDKRDFTKASRSSSGPVGSTSVNRGLGLGVNPKVGVGHADRFFIMRSTSESVPLITELEGLAATEELGDIQSKMLFFFVKD